MLGNGLYGIPLITPQGRFGPTNSIVQTSPYPVKYAKVMFPAMMMLDHWDLFLRDFLLALEVSEVKLVKIFIGGCRVTHITKETFSQHVRITLPKR